MRKYALKHSIGTKIFGAFLAMSLIVAGLGTYGYYVLFAAGRIVADTYDHPMMAINFARAASVDFLEMQNDALRADRADPAQKAAFAKQIDDVASTLSDDLDVARQRATAADERQVIGEIRTLVESWQAERHRALLTRRQANLSALEKKILDRFDLLIEFNADHGFVSRREAATHVDGYENAVIAMTVMALFLAGILTFFLAGRIVRPLSAAALVAERIASGEFETKIPKGGADETGVLLNSMQVMQDSIAEQMAREKARAQSAEGRLMDAIENSGEGVILSNGEGHIAVANSELSRLFPALAPHFASGRPLASALGLIEESCRRSTGRPLWEQLYAAGGAANAERQLPDGRWLRIAASTTSEGGAIIFFSDFSDVKAREEGYRVAQQQAEAANAAKSRFLANMSHELRTPLNAVIGFSEIIGGEILGPLGDKRYVEYSRDITNSGRQLLDLINSVLELAKSEAGTIELQKNIIDLRGLLLECAEIVGPQCESAGLSLGLPAPTPPLLIEGDGIRLRQVFLNLLSNAVKFTEKGGAVSIDIDESEDAVEIEIRDTGIGMSSKDIETALTPFAQVDNRLERRYEGAGLGLPLAKAFIESHGGTLTIRSDLGHGTVVDVRLAGLASRVRSAAGGQRA